MSSNVQKCRKEAHLTPKDVVTVFLSVANEAPNTKLGVVLEKFQQTISENLKSKVVLSAGPADALITKVCDIGKEGASVSVSIKRA